jgi:hypothetical protein
MKTHSCRFALLAFPALLAGSCHKCTPFDESVKKSTENNILQPSDPSDGNKKSYSPLLDFTLLSYNIAGLLEPISSASPAKNTPKISELTNDYDIVLVQEDFNYHASLYENNRHPHRTSTSGGMGFGDGLNTMSNFPFYDFGRKKWNDCNGADCLTPKGFTWMRLRLREGVYIDLYNVHANAGLDSGNFNARRKNISQLVNFARENSKGNAMILAGDFNCRYTRSEDNIRSVANELFATDAWVEIVMDNKEPVKGSNALKCHESNILSDYSCELVDKIFYRGNRFIKLETLNFSYKDTVFRDSGGNMLSEHRPIYAQFRIKVSNNIRLSDQFGGPHGASFNDISKLPDHPVVTSIGIRAEKRIDQINLTLTNGTQFIHGGSGGSAESLPLNKGEHVSSVKMCSGKKGIHTRIFYMEFTTNLGRSISGGAETDSTVTYAAEAGWQIVGFHGRAGTELDKCGVIYTPVKKQ